MASSTPPSLVLIYIRAALGALTKKRSLASEITRFPILPPTETLNFKIDPDHVRKFIQVVDRGGGSAATASARSSSSLVPITYLQCLLNGMPMNMLTHAQFPLNIIGSVHEFTKIESRKATHTEDVLGFEDNITMKASCYLLPEITRSDKDDLMFKLVTSIESTTFGGENINIMDITNEYRVLNPQRHKVKVVAPTNDDKAAAPINYFDATIWEPLSTWDFPMNTGRRYAALNGDINPIHMFPITAKLFGYKSCIAHGMFSVCKLINEPRFAAEEEGGAASTTVTARFTRPTMLPNPAVMTFLKKGTDEYVIGFQNKDGAFKETVKGTISSCGGSSSTA